MLSGMSRVTLDEGSGVDVKSVGIIDIFSRISSRPLSLLYLSPADYMPVLSHSKNSSSLDQPCLVELKNLNERVRKGEVCNNITREIETIVSTCKDYEEFSLKHAMVMINIHKSRGCIEVK